MKKRLKRLGKLMLKHSLPPPFFSLLTFKLFYSQQLRETLNLAEDIPIEFTAHGESPAKVAAALAAASLEENAAAADATSEATNEEEATSTEAAPAKTEA